MAQMGRPKKQINKEEFEKLCFLQCTRNEFCMWFDVSDETLNKWCKDNYNGKTFLAVFQEKKQGGLISLRRTQFQLAEKSPAMAIFLGKNLLGQSDRVEQTIKDVSEDRGITIRFNDEKAADDGSSVPDSISGAISPTSV